MFRSWPVASIEVFKVPLKVLALTEISKQVFFEIFSCLRTSIDILDDTIHRYLTKPDVVNLVPHEGNLIVSADLRAQLQIVVHNVDEVLPCVASAASRIMLKELAHSLVCDEKFLADSVTDGDWTACLSA